MVLKVDPQSSVVGFVGIGVMGRSMAGHLLRAGYKLHVHNRTRSKADDLVREGAVWEDSPAALARRCNVIITIVGFPRDVEQVYLGEDGLIANAAKGTCLIDMTTSSPGLAVRIESEARGRGLFAVDAPVSGGDRGAREATLSIMVGAAPEVFEAVRMLLEVMGRNVVLQGPAGSGQRTKMANQIAIASNMIGVCEALAYAKAAGLDPLRVLKSIESGAAGSWSLSNLGPRMIADDFAPGFYVKHFIKDMTIALEAAGSMQLRTPGLSMAGVLYKQLAERGGDNEGTQALFRLWDKA